MNLRILAVLALLPALPISAATMDTGSLNTSYVFTGGEEDPPLTAVDVSTSVTVDLSDLTGLTPGQGIVITFSTTQSLLALTGFFADDGDLTLLWHARFTLTAGTHSVSSDETWSLGPVPWVGTGSETVGYDYGPLPQSFSLLVPWGTDLSAVTLTMTDLYSVSGVNTQVTQSSLGLANATITSASFFSGSPEIEVGGNGVDIVNGDDSPEAADGTDFGIVIIDGPPATRSFTITNTGNVNLYLSGTSPVELSGSGSFTISSQPASSTIEPEGGTQTFTIAFDPITSGLHSAVVSIANDDTDENPFTFTVLGRGLSHSDDTDADGLNDASEFQMTALGFDWQVAQPELVSTYYANANAAGLYTTSQVQALHVGTPLLERDPVTGVFTMTLGVAKSTDLVHFEPFPMASPQISVNGEGKLEFRFTTPDAAAFFRVEAD